MTPTLTPVRVAAVVLVGVLLVGLGATAIAQSTPWNASSAPTGNTTAVASSQYSLANQSVSVSVNCTASSVNVTAPADYGYRLQLTTLQVNQTRTTSHTLTTGPHTGNHSVALTSPSTVYAFVQNRSTGQTVAVATAVCSTEPATKETPVPVDVTINCTTDRVRIAPADPSREYGVTVAAVTVTETTTQTERQSVTPVRGNTTVLVADDAAVYVFVTDASGDVVASARRPCPPRGATGGQSDARP